MLLEHRQGEVDIHKYAMQDVDFVKSAPYLQLKVGQLLLASFAF